MTQTEQQNVPALRFPGFEDSWQSDVLGEQCSITTGRLDANAMIKGGKYPFFTCAREVYEIDTPAFDTEALLISGNGANVGYIHYYNGKFNAYQRTYVLDGFTQDIQFVQRNLERGLRKRIFSEVKEGNTPYIVKGTLADMPINLPTLPEQRKIAGFLGAVDERIAQVTRKKALLEDYKKGCMQQLFSQSVRFQDDQGNDFPDWEERRLGDVAQFSKGKGISKADISEDGTTPCIRYGEIYTHYREHITEVRSATNATGLFLSKARDVIIPASGEDPLDMARACCVEDAGIALGGDINVLRGAENGVFLAYYLNNAKRKDIARYAQGNSVVHLYATQMRNLSLTLPHPDEQEKIADFLSAIDTKIDLVAQELEQAKTFKKALLQQMFV